MKFVAGRRVEQSAAMSGREAVEELIGGLTNAAVADKVAEFSASADRLHAHYFLEAARRIHELDAALRRVVYARDGLGRKHIDTMSDEDAHAVLAALERF